MEDLALNSLGKRPVTGLDDGVVIGPGFLQLVGEFVDGTGLLVAGDEEVGGSGGEAGNQKESVSHGEQGSLGFGFTSLPLDARCTLPDDRERFRSGRGRN